MNTFYCMKIISSVASFNKLNLKTPFIQLKGARCGNGLAEVNCSKLESKPINSIMFRLHNVGGRAETNCQSEFSAGKTQAEFGPVVTVQFINVTTINHEAHRL